MPGSEVSEIIFRWGRIQDNSDWLLPLIVFALLLIYCVRRYKIDAAQLKLWQRSLLLTLRITALAGLLLYYLHPQWENLIGNSRVVVLIDTSASMASRDVDGDQTRLDAALEWLEHSQLLEKLAEQHDVAMFGFDETLAGESPGGNPLTPDGTATALGDALYDTLQRERGQPLAGIILISDGGHNTGRPLDSPLETANRLRMPIFPIGVGQTHPPLNYRVGLIDLPDRVVPNDPFIVKVPIERVGGNPLDAPPAHRNATLELSLDDVLLESREIAFEADGIIETSFNVRLPEPGTYRLSVEVIPPPHANDAIPEDNRQQIEVHAVDRKDRILLFASTPSRDYQFICSQLFRDQTTEVDVYLSWAQPGISQNADRILDRFPSSRSEMAEYDVIIAFDPDWRELSPEQIDIFEFWVARQGGGLILVAGQIHQADSITGWVTDPGMDKIRALYPVEFLARTSAFEHRFRSSPTAHPLRFTRAGESAEFLQITDEQGAVMNFWSLFPGYFGYFAVRGVKPTATLLVSSGSPEILGREETGSLIVEQFYGAGRVLYFGSGELWRLRRIDERVFEQMITKTVRSVGQGRLQRESDRGTLATDRPRYSMGSMAQIRLTASDAQLNPLTLPALPVEVISPTGTLRMLDVMLDLNIPGTYLAYLPLDVEGTWTVQWTVPDAQSDGAEQQIVRTFQVQMSDLEREHPNRNESLLQEIAERSGGMYFADFGLAESLPERIGVRSQRAVVDGAFQEKLLYYLLLAICCILLAEWMFRRLMQLA
ncbi:MAG: VWA domain-containing protein [Planctomycetaceae bacterium]|nr:VWA domain-containing protein [Planctomycetaceae bacterium]